MLFLRHSVDRRLAPSGDCYKNLDFVLLGFQTCTAVARSPLRSWVFLVPSQYCNTIAVPFIIRYFSFCSLQINFDFCRWIQLFSKFLVYCRLQTSCFHAIKNEKILCVIKQRLHDSGCTANQQVLLPSIAIFSAKSVALPYAINMQPVLQLIPVAILKRIAVLIAIIAILQY